MNIMSKENNPHSPSEVLLLNDGEEFDTPPDDLESNGLNAYFDDDFDIEPSTSDLELAKKLHQESLEIDNSSDIPDSMYRKFDTANKYFKDSSSLPILDRASEQALAKTIKAGQQASKKLAQISLTNPELFIQDPSIKTSLLETINQGEVDKNQFIQRNFRLVFSIAKKYQSQGLEIEDLISEGNIGLMRALLKFDLNRGYKLSTYATWWIRQSITRAIADTGRNIRLPVHMGLLIGKLFKAKKHLKQDLNREPNIEELAKELDWDPAKVTNVFKYSRDTTSYDQPVDNNKSGDDESELVDFIPNDTSPDPEEETQTILLAEKLEKALSKLSPREIQVLKYRNGFINGKVVTLDVIGYKMGITRERVRQIEAQALRKLRHPNNFKKFEGFL